MEAEVCISDLKVAYGEQVVIDQMNLLIPKGKITMLIGSNGCGKSTLLKTIGRILQPAKGSVSIKGLDLQQAASREIAKKMAVLPQNPAVPSGILVKELVAYGRYPYQSPLSGLKEYDIEKIDWAMKATGVYEYREKAVEALSGGQRQRVFIAMILAQETEIMVLDEPTTYLDISHQLEILTLLQKINREENKTIIIVLHELNNATKFADHLIGMKHGEIVFEGTPKKVITKENLKILYEVDAVLQMDPTGTYPICTDFELLETSGGEYE